MLVRLVYATRWLSMHLYTLAYITMHESCLLVCCPYFNTMKLWTSNPNLHLSLVDTIFCLFICLLPFLLVCLLSHLLVYLHPCFYACHNNLACSLCVLLLLSTHFPSIACLLVSYFCLCMYVHGARMLGARARFPRHKQKRVQTQACHYEPSDAS